MNDYSDQSLSTNSQNMQLDCVACGSTFDLVAGEVAWYAAKHLKIPRRCKPCRRVRRMLHAEMQDKEYL